MKNLVWRFLPYLTASLLPACVETDVPLDTNDDPTTGGPSATTALDPDTGPPVTIPTDSLGNGSSSSGVVEDSSGSSSESSSTTEEPESTGEATVCGNNVIEGDEVCDLAQINGETCISLGYQGGQLGCNLTCTDYNVLGCFVCGNGVVDIIEDCEMVVPEGVSCESLGYEGGQLVCGGDCFYDTSDCSVCGDGVRQGDESCDGADLDGETCASLGLQGGTLQCSPGCSYDPTGCDIPGVPFGTDVGYTGYVLTPPMLPCDDISGTGNTTTLTDDSAQAVPIGFTFPVYGADFTDVTIQSNGALRWGDATYLTLTNTCLPSNTAPSTNLLYVFWDDLNPTLGAGEIYYETLGMPGDQRMVVQWDTANYSGDTADLMRFQVVLHESTGFIEVCYPDTINAVNVGNSGGEATSGIQLDSANAIQFSCNTPSLVDGTQLLYIPL